MRGWCSYISSFCIKMTQNTPSFVADDSLKINDVGGTDLHFFRESAWMCLRWRKLTTSIHCILTSIWKIVCKTTINVSYFVTWPYYAACLIHWVYFKWISSRWLIETHWYNRIWQQLSFYFFLGIQGDLGETLQWEQQNCPQVEAFILSKSYTYSSVEAYKWFRVSVTLNFLIHMK